MVGRLLCFEVLAPQWPTLKLEGYKDVGNRLSERICWLTNEVFDDPSDDESLESFLGRLVDELFAEAARFRATAARETVTPLLEELATRVKLFRTSPYDPLVELAKAVAETAADFYREYGPEVPSALWQRTQCEISFVGGEVTLSFAPDFYVQIKTQFHFTEQACADVSLKIVPRWLNTDTISILPRVMLHEYISHVPQGPYSQARIHPDADDSFAEGWMDYVAHCIHRTALERRAPSHRLADHLLFNWKGLYDDGAERLFSARRKLLDNDPAAAARCEGVITARLLHDFLRALPYTKDNADRFFYGLSFGLNTSALSSLRRRRIVAEIHRSLVFASSSNTFVWALREWVKGRIQVDDIWTFLLDQNFL